jgi:endoglucanase Acf2
MNRSVWIPVNPTSNTEMRDRNTHRDQQMDRSKTTQTRARLSRREYIRMFGAVGIGGGAMGVGSESASGATPTHAVGSGSYTTVLPSGESEPQRTIYTTSDVSGPVQTNEWWSSVLWERYGENLFWHPGFGRPNETGLRIGYPTEWTYPNADAKMVVERDFTLGHTATQFPDTRVSDWSDWSVTLTWREGSAHLSTTLVQGSPFVFCEYEGGGSELGFQTTPTVFADRGHVLGLTHERTHYGLFAPAGSDWTGVGTATLSNDLRGTDGSGYVTVAILPDDSLSTLDAFERYAYNHVTDTRVSPTYDQTEGEVRTTYQFTTTNRPESQVSGNTTVTALYPHQHKYTNETFAPYAYTCPRGQMRTVIGDSFRTTHVFPGILPSLPDEGSYDRTELQQYVQSVLAGYDDSYGTGTYWTGKNYGRMANASPIAEQIDNTSKQTALIDALKYELQNWLTAGPNESADLFYYNRNWGTLIGYPDSFGSGPRISDHHFHYGYFVRGAAEIARNDREWSVDQNWGGMIDLLIRDFANWERPSGGQDPSDNPAGAFPFLRNFSPYAGHSWASGQAIFAAGNNQESSSEAINAYASMIQWAVFTGDDRLLEWAVYLYTHEITASLEYWFDRDSENHPEGWTHNTAGIVWGSKYSYATWFSGDAEAIHGINYLPISGHSMYLGWYPSLAERNYDELVANNSGETFEYWPDIVWEYRAFSDAQDAVDMFETRKETYPVEAGETKAHTYHWLYNLLELGTPQPDITADYPLAHVFSDEGRHTYTAYNASNTETTVTFSDGVSLNVPANSFATRTGGSNDDQPQTVTRISGPDGMQNDLRFAVTFPNSEWADVHYTVNGGTMYNYRMNQDGDTHTLTTVPDYVVGDFSSGDTIRYYLTYEKNGLATDTDWSNIIY